MLRNSKNKEKVAGFSLIEILIVIGILSILATLATPAYRDYVIKANIVKTRTFMDMIRTRAQMAYIENSDSFPTELNIGSIILKDGSGDFEESQWYGSGGVGGVYWDSDDQVSYYCISVLGLQGMRDAAGNTYEEPTDGTRWTKLARYCERLKVNNGIFEIQCGIHDGSNQEDIPPEYLPAGCTCQNYFDDAATNCS